MPTRIFGTPLDVKRPKARVSGSLLVLKVGQFLMQKRQGSHGAGPAFKAAMDDFEVLPFSPPLT